MYASLAVVHGQPGWRKSTVECEAMNEIRISQPGVIVVRFNIREVLKGPVRIEPYTDALIDLYSPLFS